MSINLEPMYMLLYTEEIKIDMSMYVVPKVPMWQDSDVQMWVEPQIPVGKVGEIVYAAR